MATVRLAVAPADIVADDEDRVAEPAEQGGGVLHFTTKSYSPLLASSLLMVIVEF
jgi:chromosome condensin MukBEF complex kleisin-like MukF subunit